jgi:hypothetical protein
MSGQDKALREWLLLGGDATDPVRSGASDTGQKIAKNLLSGDGKDSL